VLGEPFTEFSVLVKKHFERFRHDECRSSIDEFSVLPEFGIYFVLNADLNRRIANYFWWSFDLSRKNDTRTAFTRRSGP
jgi:hypothetical protein